MSSRGGCVDSHSANSDASNEAAMICWVAGLEDDNQCPLPIPSSSAAESRLQPSLFYNNHSPGMFRLRAWSELHRRGRSGEEARIEVDRTTKFVVLTCSIRVGTQNGSSTQICLQIAQILPKMRVGTFYIPSHSKNRCPRMGWGIVPMVQMGTSLNFELPSLGTQSGPVE